MDIKGFWSAHFSIVTGEAVLETGYFKFLARQFFGSTSISLIKGSYKVVDDKIHGNITVTNEILDKFIVVKAGNYSITGEYKGGDVNTLVIILDSTNIRVELNRLERINQ